MHEVREPAKAYGKTKLTEAEYLDFEKSATVKHEFYQGEIFAMSGASARHNIIFKNLYRDLAFFLKGKPCQPYGSDLRLHIPENSLYTYPDISVYCGDIISSEKDADTATLPTVIIEILSPATREYDRGTKFKLYRTIPTLREYILADAAAMNVEVFTLNEENVWQLTESRLPHELMIIPSLGFSITLAEMYEGTQL